MTLESTYYKAILQNLFFATLNQEMNTPEKPNNRKFRGEGRQHYNITSLYRYKRYFKDPDDVEHPNRSALDAIIFDALDLTQGEPDGMSEAVVNLVESRLRKARSLKGK